MSVLIPKRCLIVYLLSLAVVFLWQGAGRVHADADNALPEGMVLIPEGEFIMGAQSPEDGRPGFDYGVDEEPRHKVSLKAFYMDRYEVTIGEFKEYLKATGNQWVGDKNLPDQFPPEVLFDPPERDRFPVNYITWDEANAYCRWRGKRLPTESEWEKAARESDGRIWPTGGTFVPKNANVEETRNPWPVPVGSYPEDKSPFGLYDVVGNLSEWTSSYYLPYPGNKYDDGRYSDKIFVLRGGLFFSRHRMEDLLPVPLPMRLIATGCTVFDAPKMPFDS
ncbi:MAG: SUMF1/EgtB/PvdO family nonheme iron enzyme [Nitrospirota bacterium]|nr:SUMF1/EgtB/PvdO family nonheme iron enzyme [Nitrospirota bacterium]